MTDYTPEKVNELIEQANALREQLGEGYPTTGSILDLWFRTADALESTLAELRQERERRGEAEQYAEEFLEQRNEYIGFEKQAQADLSRAEETIDRAIECLEENEDRDEVAIAILTEYGKQKEQG